MPSDKSERPLNVVITASIITKVADWGLGVVLPLAVLESTGSVATALLSFALRVMPYMVSPLIGSVIDRYDRRTVFLGALLLEAVSVGLIALLLPNKVAVACLLVASGVGAVAVTITSQFVLIPKLIEPDRQALAVARLASAIEFSKVIGLLLGGVTAGSLAPKYSVGIAAVLYLAAGLVAWSLPKLPTNGPRSTLRADLKVGFGWVVRRDIRWLVVTMALANLAVGNLETVLVTIFAQQRIPALVISAILGVGMLLGALGSRLSVHIAPRASLERRILWFQLMSFISLGITAIPALPATMVGFALVSLALGASNVASITYRQTTIPVDLAGRVNSVIRMFITGAIPLSAVIFAAASRFSGILFWLPALVCATVSVLIWAWYTVRTERVAAPNPQGIST